MIKGGIITILIGVGLFLVSILLSEGYDQRLSLMSNIYAMELVITPGRLEKIPPSEQTDIQKRLKFYPETVVGRVAIPLNLLLCLSIIITLIGTGMVLVTKRKRDEPA